MRNARTTATELIGLEAADGVEPESFSQLIELAGDGAPPREFCMLSAGETATTKGAIKCDDAHAAMCLAHEVMPADGLLPLDYDHGMVSFMGGEKKAAGWFKLANRNGSLWATEVKYTPAAEKALRDREYRYFSPALYRDEEGYVTRMVNCALTCLPATLKQKPLVASEARSAPEGNETMDLAQLCAAFGVANGTQLAALFNQLRADGARLTAENAALLSAAQAHQTELNSVRAALTARAEADAKAEKASYIEQLSSGSAPKLSPAMRPWAETQTLEQLKAYAAIAPTIAVAPAAPGSSAVVAPQSNPATQLAALTPAEITMCAQMKVRPEDFIAQRALLAAQREQNPGQALNLNVARETK